MQLLGCANKFRLSIVQYNKMQPSKKESQNAFKQIYQSSIRASYFNQFQGNAHLQKSKLQMDTIIKQTEDQVDQNTFRINTGFARPDNSFKVYAKNDRFYIEQESFFSCMFSRRKYEVQLKNQILKVSSQKLKAFFNFQTEGARIIPKTDYFILEIEGCPQQFYFQPVDKSQIRHSLDDWVTLLTKIINDSQGKKNNFNYLTQKLPEQFYKHEHVSNEQFQKSANTLDILLFKSQHSAARLQRIFTDSEYDHVGVVIRNKKNELFIFQSSSNEGVGLTPWKHMIKFQWYKACDKIAWRKMKMDVSKEDVQIIEAYVTKTLGKQWALSLQKLFLFQSTLKRSPEEEQNKTYFCSELVARLFKQLSLFDQSKASSRYYPVDFSEAVKLKILRPNVCLEDEILISFNKAAPKKG